MCAVNGGIVAITDAFYGGKLFFWNCDICEGFLFEVKVGGILGNGRPQKIEILRDFDYFFVVIFDIIFNVNFSERNFIKNTLKF